WDSVVELPVRHPSQPFDLGLQRRLLRGCCRLAARVRELADKIDKPVENKWRRAMAEKIKHVADSLAYPPRALRADRAAAYLSMSTSTFLKLVQEGDLPAPIRKNGIVSWDRLELDAAYENWKEGGGNTALKLLREHEEKHGH